ncbi:protein NUCLEAR FUSION DEFECTIVE 6, mitochondrial isoform X1 [Cryptomeria japonica]|uniref:protein NUCLEAR FUSION DEFECTIVE 6, mitochondrial isoform X1 n=1 Tax=Cryptomeria japonica TaxID=3369 RepID=UPI0027DA521E|nr:protein NUCLEAR FUSION DEFECTIVE 6, mitochondrial isoform X1 [Cryptomeria japonica]
MANLSRSAMGCLRSIGGNLKTQAQVRTSAKSSAPLRSSPSLFSFSIRTDNPRRLFSITRLPVELGCCIESLIPLHSAVASARLTSRLSINSRSLSQELGLSVPR